MHQQRPQALGRSRVGVPARPAQDGERLSILAVEPDGGRIGFHALKPGTEARRRREGDERLEARQVARELLHHLLDQEVAEGDAAQPLLAVADRVEDGRGRLLGCQHLPVFGQELLDRARDLAGQRHLDEDQRLVDQRGMEEAEAAAVRGLHAPAKVVPALDLVHGLVADDPLQDIGRSGPVDPAQNEKAAVEPGIEEMDEIIVDAGKLRIPAAVLEQVLAHVDQGCRAARGEIEAAEQLLPRRLDSTQQRLETGGRGVRIVGGPRRPQPHLVGSEIAREEAEEVQPLGHRQAGVEIQHLAGKSHA
jgi:hypothetical protein